MHKYFGTDGIRLHAEDFTYDFLAAVVRGLIAYHGSADFSLLIGGDTRESTARILADLSAIATAAHIDVTSIGVFPTPAINFYTQAAGFDFAIDVTASHNPATYNGLKIFELKDGKSTKLGESGRNVVEESLRNSFLRDCPDGNPQAQERYSVDSATDRTPAENHCVEAIDAYLTHLRDYLGACDFRGLKLAMDCANGATSIFADRLFREFGAEVTVISADQNFGTSINASCGSTHLENLQQLVVERQLDFGVAFDGDGDRCLLVDHTGAVVDGDKILAILADYFNLKSFATTVMANQGLFAWAATKGITIEITDVGDQNVFARMQEKSLKLGGEQSGHIILPYEPMGDGMLTVLMITKILSERQITLAELAAAIPTYPQYMLNLPATAEQKSHLASAPATEIIAKYSTFLESRGGRLLVRPSGTEDLIRLTMWGTADLNIEALTTALANELKGVL